MQLLGKGMLLYHIWPAVDRTTTQRQEIVNKYARFLTPQWENAEANSTLYFRGLPEGLNHTFSVVICAVFAFYHPHSWSHFPIFSRCFLELPFFKIIWPQIHVSRFAFEKSKSGHIQTLRQHAHIHMHTHTCLFILEMGGWRPQRCTSQSLAFLNLLFVVYWVSNPISYTTQPRNNGLLSAVLLFLILWDSWFVLELINKSMLYGHLFCIYNLSVSEEGNIKIVF